MWLQSSTDQLTGLRISYLNEYYPEPYQQTGFCHCQSDFHKVMMK